MIADDERAVGLAGIMGGEETEVSAATTNVLLEAANFEPVGILRSSERHALRTEGSNRWEKGVDPYVAGQAATYATQLIVELSGARWTGAEDVQGDAARAGGDPAAAGARERADRARRWPPSEQVEILGRIGFEPAREWLPRADLARARRDARGRPDRGGRALQAARDPVHAAAARGDVRAADPRAAPAPAGGGRARRRRLRRGVHADLRRRGRPAAAGAALRRGGRAPHRPLRLAARARAP